MWLNISRIMRVRLIMGMADERSLYEELIQIPKPNDIFIIKYFKYFSESFNEVEKLTFEQSGGAE